MGCSCLPMTKYAFEGTRFIQQIDKPEHVKFTSIAGRIECLKIALFGLGYTIISPVGAALACKDLYTDKKSNPLDVLIAIVVSPIFILFCSLRCLLGGLLHPAIALKYIPPEPNDKFCACAGGSTGCALNNIQTVNKEK